LTGVLVDFFETL
jgi:hypothetical protein